MQLFFLLFFLELFAAGAGAGAFAFVAIKQAITTLNFKEHHEEEKYFLQVMKRGRQEQGLSVNYHFTRRCNYKCKFCFHTGNNKHSKYFWFHSRFILNVFFSYLFCSRNLSKLLLETMKT